MCQVEWTEVKRLFEEHGCVVVGHPELRWYQESWGALARAGLTEVADTGELELTEVVVRLRSVCLLAMYLGIYRAAGHASDLGGYSEGPGNVWEYMESLEVGAEEILQVARLSGLTELTRAISGEDDKHDHIDLDEIAMSMIQDENASIFSTLKDHYGDNVGLFVSIWNSRLPLDKIEPVDAVVNSTCWGDGKQEVWMYMESGMKDWI